jgi:hypothetical protein
MVLSTSTLDQNHFIGQGAITKRCSCSNPEWERVGKKRIIQIKGIFPNTACCTEPLVCGKQVQAFRCRKCREMEDRVEVEKVIFCLSCRRRIDEL